MNSLKNKLLTYSTEMTMARESIPLRCVRRRKKVWSVWSCTVVTVAVVVEVVVGGGRWW